MAQEHTRRILLVEDQPFHYNTLLRRLEQAGYNVILANDYPTALKLLETANFHVAVFDICLDRTAGKNEDGLRLLEDRARLGLRDLMPTIVLTRYSTEDRALKALTSLGAAGYIRKESGYLGKLSETIQNLFETQVGINFELRYEGDALHQLEECVNDIYAGEEQLPPVEVLSPEARDLMGRLFPGAEALVVRRLPKGLSGSAVLRIHPTYPSGLARWFLAKVGRRDKTLTEEKNYQSYVERFLSTNHTTQLTARYTRHLGALLYTLDTDAVKTKDFAEFYHQNPTPKIEAALNNLFRVTCGLWYENRTPPKYQNLRDIYLEAFNLTEQPERLPNEIAAMRPDFDRRAALIRFDSLALRLPNPIRWLEESDAGLLPVSRCITHGDLHAGNILMNEAGECWLIDFYRTHSSHILRDMVKLEVDIKFNLLEALPIDEFYKFERALLQAVGPQKIKSTTKGRASAHKAAQVIAGLRNEAWLLLDGPRVSAARQAELQYEYLFSLLMTTLNVLRLRHYKQEPALQPYRELALLSAAMICERLEQLRSS